MTRTVKARHAVGSGSWRRGAAVAIVLVMAALLADAAPLWAQIRATPLYKLSNFSGRLKYDWAQVEVDREHDEIYVVYQNVVRVFNASGMEVFSFGDDLAVGLMLDVAVAPDGDLILLSFKDNQPVVTRCNYRGVPLGAMEVKNLPDGVDFRPNRVVLRGDLLYFASTSLGTVVVTDLHGQFRDHIRLLSLVESGETQHEGAEILGFTVDDDGNILFTVAVFFKAYRISPDRKVTSFGKPGSTPGKFGIAAGIATDSRGNIYIADRLKGVVIVFNKETTFITEFGARGKPADVLVLPDALAIDRQNRLYVTQGRRRGIAVFALEGE